jgi:PAS domain S-box-containing protein
MKFQPPAYPPSLKASIAMEAVRGEGSEADIAARHGIDAALVRQWRAQLMANAERAFDDSALRESEAKFRTIANAMPQMVWSTLPDGYHDYYNWQWYDYTGVPEGSTDGALWKDMFHPDDQPQAWARWQHCLATGELYEVEYRLRHRSGQYRWTLGRALPLRDEQGRIVRWMGTCTDIHDQKTTSEDLLKASRRKDDFLAMLAHELRNPLAPISTAAQLLALFPSDPARVRSASAIIVRQVAHMNELVNDLLDVSRVTRGLVELQKDSVDLKLVVNAAIEQARPIMETRRHGLHIHMTAEHPFVQGDRTRLVQVLVNVLTNAAKYTPQGGDIHLALDMDGAQAVICVSDNGVGIDAALLPHIFELFTQGERTPDRSQGGLGLGLALVKSMMELHGGLVTVASDGAGQGSRFTLRLPVETAPAAGAAGAIGAPAGQRARALSVMIVDDNADAAHMLAALLEAIGHSVSVTDSAAAAIEQGSRNPPQVFILDIGLPEVDGYQLARALRANSATCQAQLIALTGYGQAHDKVLAWSAGFDQYFIKPVDIVALQKVLTGRSGEHGKP